MTDEVSAPRWWKSRIVVPVVAAVAAAAATVAVYTVHGGHSDHHSSAAGIDARAAEVMPFDQAATRHIFLKNDAGGVETVLAIDPADQRNIGLVRTHLQEEAVKFRQGDYDDPARIHGMDMPGLTELTAGAGRVKVDYAELPDGARITYSSTESGLVSALHSWFDRQTSDHGH